MKQSNRSMSHVNFNRKEVTVAKNISHLCEFMYMYSHVHAHVHTCSSIVGQQLCVLHCSAARSTVHWNSPHPLQSSWQLHALLQASHTTWWCHNHTHIYHSVTRGRAATAATLCARVSDVLPEVSLTQPSSTHTQSGDRRSQSESFV